jgi:predicted acyl esterase
MTASAADGAGEPHPALKVAVPMNPMVDGWRGDDWFHNGAFRQMNLAYILEQVATRRSGASGSAAITTITTLFCAPARPANWHASAAWSRWASGAS